VNVGRHRVDFSLHRQELDQAVREGLAQVEFVVESRDVFDLASIDVIGQLATGVRLESVGRILGLQARLEHVLCGTARATRDGAIDELNLGVLLVEYLDESIEARFLRALGPPREHLDRVGPASGTATGGVGTCCERAKRNTSGRESEESPPCDHCCSPLNNRGIVAECRDAAALL